LCEECFEVVLTKAAGGKSPNFLCRPRRKRHTLVAKSAVQRSRANGELLGDVRRVGFGELDLKSVRLPLDIDIVQRNCGRSIV
jgi:hypothetical protein